MALRRSLQKSDALISRLLAPLKMPSQQILPIQLPEAPKPVEHPDFKINNGSDNFFPRQNLAEQQNNGGNAGKKLPEDFVFIYIKK